jgi:SPX domain
MRPGVRLPVQSSVFVNESPTPPTRGQSKKQSRNSRWLPKFAFAPDHIVDILGLRYSGNSEPPLELEDLANTFQNPPGDKGAPSSAARRRSDKRLHKLERLAEQEEMKFSHSIQFNAVPDWSNHYIAYSNLKKL